MQQFGIIGDAGIALWEEPLLVRFTNARINVWLAMERIADGTYRKYRLNSQDQCNYKYSTHLADNFSQTFFGQNLLNMVQWSSAEDGIWYSTFWHQHDYTQLFDTVFYDEFLFMVGEGIVEFDDFETLTRKQIRDNYDAYNARNEVCDDRLSGMAGARDARTLRGEYFSIIKGNFSAGEYTDEELVKKATILYQVLDKKFRKK